MLHPPTEAEIERQNMRASSVTWQEKLPQVPLAKIGTMERKLASDRDQLKKELSIKSKNLDQLGRNPSLFSEQEMYRVTIVAILERGI